MKEIIKKFEHMDIKTAAIYSIVVAVVGTIVTGSVLIFKKRSSEDK